VIGVLAALTSVNEEKLLVVLYWNFTVVEYKFALTVAFNVAIDWLKLLAADKETVGANATDEAINPRLIGITNSNRQ
jgi:hypothetical protein